MEQSKKIIRADGTIQYRLNGKPHREDGPAVVWPDGTKIWYINGVLHRIDGPAVEWSNGSKEWWVNDKLHRLDGPAIIDADGSKEYYLFGEEYDNIEAFEASTSILRMIQQKSKVTPTPNLEKG